MAAVEIESRPATRRSMSMPAFLTQSLQTNNGNFLVESVVDEIPFPRPEGESIQLLLYS